MTDFNSILADRVGAPLLRGPVRTLQLNVTLRCNLACHHCHVESSPKRSEAMDDAVVERVRELIDRNPGLEVVDITGGAPEMHPRFRDLVRHAKGRGLEVIDRCNLTIFYEAGYETLPQFLADEGVAIIASLPCYTQDNVDAQRGRRVYDRSVEALKWLNGLGYGRPSSPLRLDLVYNPLGASLPPPQPELESDYRRELSERFGIEFHRLLTLTNMPITRFAALLERRGEAAAYQALLVNHFNPETVPHLMCRSLVSVGHDGRVFDCDFNQALGLGLEAGAKTIWDLDDLLELEGQPIATASHCFGCTAGAGSSCGGSLV